MVFGDYEHWTSDPGQVEVAEHLKICDASGRRLVGITSGHAAAGEDDVQQTTALAVVGDAVVAYGGYYLGGGGSGNTSGAGETVYVPRTQGAVPVNARFAVATTAAAAWATTDAIWVSDADGVRRTDLAVDGLRGLRLDGENLVASKATGSQRVTLRRLPARSVRVPQSRTADANFGQCPTQFAASCPIPETDG